MSFIHKKVMSRKTDQTQKDQGSSSEEENVSPPHQGTGDINDYVTFFVRNQFIGVPISGVQEVLISNTLCPVPSSPRNIAGIFNLRGEIVTVIDMHVLLQMESGEEAAQIPADSIQKNRIPPEDHGDPQDQPKEQIHPEEKPEEKIDNESQSKEPIDAGQEKAPRDVPADSKPAALQNQSESLEAEEIADVPDAQQEEKEYMHVIIQQDSDSYSLRVDSVGDVLTIETESLSRPPSTMNSRWQQCCSGVYHINNQMLAIINTDALIQLMRDEDVSEEESGSLTKV